MSFNDLELTPKEIVAELDKYVIGQFEAKKSVAIALRNRYRRKQLEQPLKDEVIPKNIIMIGPTGVGKTEIARRLARLVSAPLVKVEATKFTEVGYVGRDVDSIIRDLVEASVRIVKKEKMNKLEARARAMAEDRLLELLSPVPGRPKPPGSPLDFLFQASRDMGASDSEPSGSEHEEQLKKAEEDRLIMKQKLLRGEMEDRLVEVEVEDRAPPVMEMFSGMGMEEMGMNIQDLFGNLMPKKKKKKKLPVQQARRVLQQEEAEKLVDMDDIINEAVERAEQAGIVFLDEIDKVTGKDGAKSGPDVSREGVQRDILPIVEGSTVLTKYGPVKTDYMLFIAAGAFHFAKPTDLIPELQGRFPIRVELQSLENEDFIKILQDTKNALTKQYTALLMTEGVSVEFSADGIEEIANIACILNEEMENIGARRLHTIMEKLFEDISYGAPELEGESFTINREYVKNKLNSIVTNKDLSKYIL